MLCGVRARSATLCTCGPAPQLQGAVWGLIACKYAATLLQPMHNLCSRYLDVRDETYREALLSAAAAAQVRPCVPRSLMLCTACSA